MAKNGCSRQRQTQSQTVQKTSPSQQNPDLSNCSPAITGHIRQGGSHYGGGSPQWRYRHTTCQLRQQSLPVTTANSCTREGEAVFCLGAKTSHVFQQGSQKNRTYSYANCGNGHRQRLECHLLLQKGNLRASPHFRKEASRHHLASCSAMLQ